MVRRLAVLVLVAAAFVLMPQADAVELGLADIALGQSAVDLFNQEPYGPPDFIGPAGAVTTWGITLTETPTPAGARPAAARGAVPARGGVGAPAPAARPTGGLQLRLGGGRGEDRPSTPAAPTVGARPPMLRLGGGRTTPGAAGRGVARPQAAATPAASGGQTYWLYNQPGGVQIVAGIEADGKVNSVILSGQSYPAKTEGGVALGDSYKSVLDKYGYPDTTRNAGDALILSYRNAGLTLTLQNLRVQTIALAKPAPLGAAIAPGGPAAPTAPARTGVRPLGPTRPGVARPRTAPGTPGTPGQRPRLRLRLGGGRED